MIIRNLRAFMIISLTIEIYNKHKSLPVWLWDKSYAFDFVTMQLHSILVAMHLQRFALQALYQIALNYSVLPCILIALNCIPFKFYTAHCSFAVLQCFWLLSMSFTPFQHFLSTVTLHWNCRHAICLNLKLKFNLKRLNSHFKEQLPLFFLYWAAVSLQHLSSVLRPSSGALV